MSWPGLLSSLLSDLSVLNALFSARLSGSLRLPVRALPDFLSPSLDASGCLSSFLVTEGEKSLRLKLRSIEDFERRIPCSIADVNEACRMAEGSTSRDAGRHRILVQMRPFRVAHGLKTRECQ